MNCTGPKLIDLLSNPPLNFNCWVCYENDFTNYPTTYQRPKQTLQKPPRSRFLKKVWKKWHLISAEMEWSLFLAKMKFHFCRRKWNAFHFGQNEMVISFWQKGEDQLFWTNWDEINFISVIIQWLSHFRSK